MIKNPLVDVEELINTLNRGDVITLNSIVNEFDISPTKAHSRYIYSLLRDKNIKVLSTFNYLKRVYKKSDIKNINLNLITNYDDIDISKERETLQKDINLYIAMLKGREYCPQDRVEDAYFMKEIKEGRDFVFDALCLKVSIVETILNSLKMENLSLYRDSDYLPILLKRVDAIESAKKSWQEERIKLKALKKEKARKDEIFYQKLKVAYKQDIFKREVFTIFSLYELVNEFIKLIYENGFENFKISKKEIKKISYQIKAGMKKIEIAKTEIAKSTLRLVFAIAKRYENENFSTFDLIEEGNISLIEALNNLEYTKKTQYSLPFYFTWWIKKHFDKIVEEGVERFSILKYKKRD